MSKYIDADELKVFMRTMLTGNDLYTPNGIDEFVDGLPAADVVKRVYRGRRPSDDLIKVVRCKDCKYQNKGQNESEMWNMCEYRSWLYFPVNDEDFCSKGERNE